MISTSNRHSISFLGNSNKCSLDGCAKWLSTVLKDHKSAEAIVLSHESYKKEVREEASQQGFDIKNVEVRKGENYSCKPAYFVIPNIIDAETKCELLTALEPIKLTQLDLRIIKLSGKGRGLVFSFKSSFGHNIFVMLIVYSSR